MFFTSLRVFIFYHFPPTSKSGKSSPKLHNVRGKEERRWIKRPAGQWVQAGYSFKGPFPPPYIMSTTSSTFRPGALQDFDKSGAGDKQEKASSSDAATTEGAEGSEDPDAFFMWVTAELQHGTWTLYSDLQEWPKSIVLASKGFLRFRLLFWLFDGCLDFLNCLDSWKI